MPAKRLPVIGAAALLLAVRPLALPAQSPSLPPSPDQSAAELYRLVNGLTVTPRVLVIGMHPDDENSQLIAWLSRGRNIETAYLSVTRGEAGQNFGGEESGSTLGAIRTQEALAARRIDGAKQFYTRAYDFGFARSANDVFKQWNRDSVVGDIVAVIRAFRPHVIVAVFPDSVADGDGQHQALAVLTDNAFMSSADPRRFPAIRFGTPWPVAKMYRPGTGLRIETAEYDRVLGESYPAVAIDVRAQFRSQASPGALTTRPTLIDLHRAASRVGDSAAVDQTLFGAVDTSFARLAVNAPPEVAAGIPLIAAYADSARRALDAVHPAAAIPYLAQVARLATSARAATPWCKHASASTAPPAIPPDSCDTGSLDLDASIDLVRERAVAALLIAAGVSFEATADRELVATGDTSTVTVTMHNRGTTPVTFADLAVWGSVPSSMQPIVMPPDSTAHLYRLVTGLADPHPWWVGPRGGVHRGGDRFKDVLSPLDGLSRSELVPGPLGQFGVGVPETIRRTSDASVTVTVAGATVTTSIGPVIYRYADASVGLQNRPLAGIPNVTLQFARRLEWIPRNKPLSRALRVAVKSHSEHTQRFDLEVVLPQGMPLGIHVDSLPPSLSLEPREQRELFVQLRGKLVDTARVPFALEGSPRINKTDPKTYKEFGENATYQTGFQTVQRDYLPPIRLLPTSGVWIQPIDVEVPPNLTMLYVPGVSDDVASALKQIGVWATETANADQLLTVDLSKVTTIAIGPRAFEVQPDLAGQSARLLEFVRKGGTLVVMRGDSRTASSPLFPYPITLARPRAERVVQTDAPVTVVDPKARVLNWPNKLGPTDWTNWIGERAQWVPTTVDSRYTKLIEVHDPEEKENSNSILLARVGKGVLIYTTLTLEQQIAGGVPGGLRLLVNLLSAGLTPAR